MVVQESSSTPAKRRKMDDVPPLLPPLPPAHFESGYLDRPSPPQAEYTAETVTESAALAQFQQQGFLVVRGLLSADEVGSAKERLEFICNQWKDGVCPGRGVKTEAPMTPLVDIDPDFESGRRAMPEKLIDAVRRFFRLAVHDDYFRELICLPKLLAPLKLLWGEDIAVVQSMALCKPPGTGEKRWHADLGYFRLHPPKLAAFWIALDAVDVNNGCMYVQPRSHLAGTPLHEIPPLGVDGRTMMEHPKCYVFYSARDKPPIDETFAVPMSAGDALLFDGNLLHYTPPNNTGRRRRALQFHYAAASCSPIACSGENAVKAPNSVYGPVPLQAAGFDCAPGAKDCVEPQHWYYRKAEIMASGVRAGDQCI